MRIIVASRSWPAYEKSGVSLAAQMHVKWLLEAGNDVFILGSDERISLEMVEVSGKYCIPSKGSGALYSPAKVDKRLLTKTIKQIGPDLVILEAWQTALTDSTLMLANKMKIPTLMISHGISIHPYANTIRHWIRAIAWWPYRFFLLPKLIKKLSAITTLDLQSQSLRFDDRNMAVFLNKPVVELANAPIHHANLFVPRSRRKSQILCVGYFSLIKNQLRVLEILKNLPDYIEVAFIGKRDGCYYQKCQKIVNDYGLRDRVKFFDGEECDIAKEISESMVLFQPSITEALPIALIESMASGTPFVATTVGAVPSLSGGILANNLSDQIAAILKIFDNAYLWEEMSQAGLTDYEGRFSHKRIRENLLQSIEVATQKKGGQLRCQS